VSLCNYALLPETVKVLGTLLVDILRKPFQLFRPILSDVSSIKSTILSVLISVEETNKNQLEPDQEGMEIAAVLHNVLY